MRCRSRSSIRVVTASGKRNVSRELVFGEIAVKTAISIRNRLIVLIYEIRIGGQCRAGDQDKCTRLVAEKIGVDKASIIEARYPQSDIYHRRSLMRRNVKLITTLDDDDAQ